MDIRLFLNTALKFNPGSPAFLHWFVNAASGEVFQLHVEAYIDVEEKLWAGEIPLVESLSEGQAHDFFQSITVPEQSGHYLLHIEVKCRDQHGQLWHAVRKQPLMKIDGQQGTEYEFNLENVQSGRLVDMIGVDASKVIVNAKDVNKLECFDGWRGIKDAEMTSAEAYFSTEIETDWAKIPIILNPVPEQQNTEQKLMHKLDEIMSDMCVATDERLWQLGTVLSDNSLLGIGMPSAATGTVEGRLQRTLRMDKDPVTLQLQSEKGGYLSLFNLGTSGNLTLLCPNFFSSPRRSYLPPHQLIYLPSQPLLPLPEDDLIVSFVAGEERVLALVTPEPLCDASWLAGLNEFDCFSTLDSNQQNEFITRLCASFTQSQAALLSFTTREA